ncbi:Cu,Zn superoxide dismutase [Fennellomyces sp. T-0311]|nr:Cu,Zn superoxide dismutase [Fennellomyces sp. T-0311]
MVSAVALLQNAVSIAIGLVWFTQDGNQTTIYANLTGVPPGKHGLHVHQIGDLSQGCASLGGHFNPFKMNHGGPEDNVKHVGDFGNVEADSDGNVQFRLAVDCLELSGLNSILGRGIVLHAEEDDLGKGDNDDSKLTGNSGDRFACGIIGIANELYDD